MISKTVGIIMLRYRFCTRVQSKDRLTFISKYLYTTNKKQKV